MEEPIAAFEKARWNNRVGTLRVYDNRVEETWRGVFRMKSKVWPLSGVAVLRMSGSKTVSAAGPVGTGYFWYRFRRKEEAREFYELVSSLL